MSWSCKQCETVNEDNVRICEVCDAVSPHLISFDYGCAMLGNPTTVKWRTEFCDKVVLSCGGKIYDVTLKNETKLSITNGSIVKFILKNENAERVFTFDISKQIESFTDDQGVEVNNNVASPSIEELKTSISELNDDEFLIVTWETKGAKYVTLNGTRVPACGSKEILATDEIVLKASNEFKRTEKKLGIRVLHKMKIQDFSVNSNIIEEGEFCTISWNAINVRSIKFDGNDLSGKNQYSFIPTVSRRYIIEFDGFDGTIINKEFKITLKEPTPIISLDFPDSLYVGDTAIVKWRAKNIDKVIVDGKEFKAHGEYQYAFNDIDKVLYFYFRGKLVETRTIKINKLMPEKPIINSFSADKTEIYEGDAIDLSWNYTHGEKCFLNSQPITSKSFHETLNSDKTYVLKVINRTEITQKTLFVKVLKKPTIRLSTDKNEIDKNFESEVNIRWQVFDAYSISMVTPSGTYNIGQNGTKSLKIKDTTIITIKAIGLDRKTEFCQELCIKAKEVKKYCTKCGRQYILAPDKNFCIHCGQKLSGGKKSFFNLF